MAIQETSGHQLDVGDKVKMNIAAIGAGDLDGVEFTNTGKDYWRYMNEHPDEVYTVTKLDLDQEPCIYVLSGYMGDNTWAADELIHIPEPTSVFEVMKNLTREESPAFILSMIHHLCKDGIPSLETVLTWLDSQPRQNNTRDAFLISNGKSWVAYRNEHTK